MSSDSKAVAIWTTLCILLWVMSVRIKPAAKVILNTTLTIVTFFAPLSSWASSQGLSELECDASIVTDLRPSLPPIRDQYDVGWCYAFTAADLLSFYFGQAISPIGLALDYTQTNAKINRITAMTDHFDFNPDLVFYGGALSVEAALQDLKDGYCAESALPNENEIDSSVFGEDSQSPGVHIELSKNIFRWYREVENSTYVAESGETLYSKVRALFPFVDQGSFAEIARSTDRNQRIWGYANKSCENHRYHLQGMKLTSYRNKAPLPLAQPIFKLNQNYRSHHDILVEMSRFIGKQLPVAVEYDAIAISPTSGGHASLVVGKRWNSQRQSCEFLVRNSWGKSCLGYNSEVECDRTNPGNIWVSAERLFKYVIGISTFEPRF